MGAADKRMQGVGTAVRGIGFLEQIRFVEHQILRHAITEVSPSAMWMG
jgi:hypothetical protein